MTTKSNVLSVSTILSAIAALALLPVSAMVGVTAVTALGLLAIFSADYGRALEPLGVGGQLIAFDLGNRRPDRLARAA